MTNIVSIFKRQLQQLCAVTDAMNYNTISYYRTTSDCGSS